MAKKTAPRSPKHPVIQEGKFPTHRLGQVRIDFSVNHRFALSGFGHDPAQRVDDHAVTGIPLALVDPGTVARNQISQILVGTGAVEKPSGLQAGMRPRFLLWRRR
jgi:hypothetical protein